MEHSQEQYGLTDYALKLVRHKARQIVGKAGYTETDVEDIQQDLTLDLLERLGKFDPAKAKYSTFVTRLVERKISKLLRARLAAMRDHRREVCSVNDEIDVGEDQPVQRVAAISQDDNDLRTGKYNRPAEERADLALDLRMVLDDLPVKLREVAQMLMSNSITEVARELGMPRSTFYDTRLKPLREALAERGLGDYL